MRWLLTPFVLLLAFFSGNSEHRLHARMVDRVSASVVRLTGGVGVDPENAPYGYVCTGEVIAPNLVLTAAHCLMQGLLIDDLQPGEVVRLDNFFDLAAIQFKTSKPVLEMRQAKIERFEPLTAVGYAYGWYKLSALHEIPFLLDYTPDVGPELARAPGIFVQGGYVGGMSGGPVVDRDGLMVSIVQISIQPREGGQAGYGVTAETIRTFLAGLL